MFTKCPGALRHIGRLLGGLFAATLLTTAQAADPGITDSTITLGMSSPFSGPNGAYGLDMKEAVEAHFAEVNAAGGINGRKLKLVSYDDGYETERSVANTKTLIEKDRVFALIAFYGSSPTTAAMKVFSGAKVPLVGTISGANTLRDPVNRYMFNLRASYADETEAIVNQLVSLGQKNIAVFYQNDGFGKSGLEGVIKALKKYDLTPSATGTVERNSLDVADAVKAISPKNPDAVIMVTLYKPTAAFVTAMRKAGQQPQFMTLSPVGADLLVKEMGPEARGIGISQVMPYPWNDTTPVVRDYQKAVTAHAKHSNYSYYGIEGYLNARLVVEALRRSGRDLSREKYIDTLNSLSNLDLGGFRVGFSSANHSGSRFVDLSIIGSGGKVLR